MKFNLDSPQFNSAAPASTRSTFFSLSTIEGTNQPIDLQPYMESLGRHGALYQLMDDNFMQAMVQRVAHRQGQELADGVAPAIVAQIQTQAVKFFKYLVPDKPYLLDSSLISHLTFPGDGRTFSKLGFLNENSKIPAFMTFVGQFIDHDLTLNPFDLFRDQDDNPVPNEASPLIDLDSVYERDSMLSNDTGNIFNADGTFNLRKLPKPNAYDLPRDAAGKPAIFDLRNDENKMILQIHILLMRIHNKLVGQLPAADTAGKTSSEISALVRSEVLFNWQSFILHDYLPTVVDAEPLNWVLTEIEKDNHGALRHKPDSTGMVQMPHEFAIGFRMGHTQLRDSYQVQPGGEHIPLFDNRSVAPNHDLRGNQPLPENHVIDWPFFSNRSVLSNKIDTHVTSVVFDLPQSTIPDMVKQVGNLPQRNLIRSSQVGLAAAEDLVKLYAIENQQLTANQIEPDPKLRKLFQLDKDGNYNPGNDFRTPLWYYVIKEAELCTCGKQLGPLGGRIIAEVIAGGIYYQPDATLSVVKNPTWQSKITGNQHVRFEDLIAFATE